MSFHNPLLQSPSRPLPTRVGVIGAGTIGPDIGYYVASTLDCELVLVDVDEAALTSATRRIEAYVEKGIFRHKLTPTEAERVRGNVITTIDYDDLAGCDWVIEAATEDIELKRNIFKQVEAIVSDDAIITSNTSSLPAGWLFSGLSHPQRATVTHFFAPAFQNPIVEVVDWDGVSTEVVDQLRRLFAQTGKVPLLTSDVPCFMLDRVFDNWCNESGYLLEGASPAEVDSVAGEFVHAGPFFVLNLANGNPIIVETNTLQMTEEGDHYLPAPVFSTVDTWDTISPGEHIEVEADTASGIRDRLLGVLFSQTVDILDRSIGSPADLELGCELALGFKKGPLRLMEDLGHEEVERILERLQRERPGMPVPGWALDGYQGFRRHLLVDDIDGVKVITIRRPGALNTLDDEVNAELLGVLQEHENDPSTLGFVITGYGERAFSAGADIGRFPEMLGDMEASTQYARDCSLVLTHLDSMTKPVVAALNGMALGGGLELAMRCHGIVAREGTWLQLPEATLGIAPGIGGMVVPYRRWPAAAPILHDMLRTADKLTVEDAHELGIVDMLAADLVSLFENALTRVRELSGKIQRPMEGHIEIPPFTRLDRDVIDAKAVSEETVRIIESAVLKAAAAPRLNDALEIGYSAFAASACTDVARENITAFVSRGKG